MSIFIQVGLLFFLLLVLNWVTDRSKGKMAEAQKAQENKAEERKAETKGGKEKFVCSECGAEVPVDAKTCPQCGEKFDDDGEYVCTECGAKVKESDKKCWNCGKEFEN